MRKNKMAHIPILQMTLDAQTGTAGVETRLESFIDILKMRREVEAGNGRENEA
jgi:predicted nucleotide-binding protein (sugar kinase/HSP70/actin superfamily)